MGIIVNGRNIEITDAIKAYTKEKIGKVLGHYDQIQNIEVVLSVIKNPSVSESHTAEVICKMTTGSIKLEETAESMYSAIDLIADKLLRQVEKHKSKYIKAAKNASIRTDGIPDEDETEK